MKTLDKALSGKEIIIVSLDGGQFFQQRIRELGLIKGQKIKIIRNDGVGPLIVNVNGTRVAIGRGMCQKIQYEEV